MCLLIQIGRAVTYKSQEHVLLGPCLPFKEKLKQSLDHPVEVQESRRGKLYRGRYTRLDVGTMAVDALTQGVVYVLQPALASRHVVKEYFRV